MSQKRLIDEIALPEGIKDLDEKKLQSLCDEIREIIINTISENGGHLSSNLGIVELTVALHRVFNFNEDVIVWDVGHQSYVHKLLTDRKDVFDTIRKYEGLSGFPKIDESRYDFFNTGHSSTAISAAFGYAKAKTIKNEPGISIAVVGDGAMTGGMSFEALNDAGASKDNLMVILNDNEMSISKNVGSIPKYLSKIRSKTFYYKTNVRVKKVIEKLPFIGKGISVTIHRVKGAIKYFYTNEPLFEEFGFRYYGPIDGHDILAMEKIFTSIKDVKGPKLVHIITKKGKGYDKAECDPHFYHGVNKFDVINGVDNNGNGKTFSEITGELLTNLADKDKDIVVVCPAMTIGSGLTEFSHKHPDRYFDVGIAEQHAVTFAAGMSLKSLKPVVVMYSTFMQRAYDQILHDVCLMNLNVLFCIDRAGIVPHDGETHQGIYDISYLSHMPNIVIFAPSNKKDYEAMLNKAIYDINGPVAIRYPKGSCHIKDVDINDPFKANVIRKGNDTCIISYGRVLSECIAAAEILTDFNIQCTVVDLKCIKPIDFETVISEIRKVKVSFCFEDTVEESSCSARILQYMKKENMTEKFYGVTILKGTVGQGSVKELLKENNLDRESIAEAIIKYRYET